MNRCVSLRPRVLVLALAAAAGLAACNDRNTEAPPSTDAAVATPDTTAARPGAAVSDVAAPADAATTPAAPGTPAAMPPVDDDTFYTKALAGGTAEIQAGEAAQKTSKTPGIVDFGKTLVKDHTDANRKLAEASGKPATPPLDAQHRQAMERLSGLSGEAFDRAWLEQMERDHAEAIALFENAAASAQTSQKAKDLARATLPALRQHAETVRTLRGSPAAE